MRNVIATLTVATLLAGTSSTVFSQENPLPQQCRHAGNEQMAGMDMSKMDASGMDAAHQAYMASMTKMEPAMMEGIKAKNADVAFICGMIAHHQGAIDMAEVELKYGDNADAKKKAQMVIDAQKKEIKDYTKWLKTNAK